MGTCCHIDDIVLRDRNTTGGVTLNERFYAEQDANWNIVAIVNVSGVVSERYGYSGYGVPAYLTPEFVTELTSGFDWELLFAAYCYDSTLGLYRVRQRILDSLTGTWLARDPSLYRDSLNLYRVWSVRPSSLR